MIKMISKIGLLLCIGSSMSFAASNNKKDENGGFIIPKYINYIGKGNVQDTDSFEVIVGYKVQKYVSVMIPYSQGTIEEGNNEADFQRYGSLLGIEVPVTENFSFSTKIGYIWEDVDGFDKESGLAYGLDLNYYFSKNLALVASYDRNELDNTFSEESMSAGIKISF